MTQKEPSVQFVPGGPEIPLRLLEMVERDEVVFFCGPEVARGLGPDGFGEVVERVRQRIPADFTPAERADYEQGHYDRVLGSLEQRFGGLVREQVKAVMTPAAGSSTGTQNALVRLANTRPGTLRLVTTNLDRGFVEQLPPACEYDTAPRLPSPTREGWRSLVHLHGLLGDGRREGALILTSSDFRRAYLTERWAARFLTALCRNFTVLFIGYDLNDVFLRYSMEAVAGPSGTSGEGRLYLFTRADAPAGETSEIWASRGLTPIEYASDEKLAATLRVWSQRQHEVRHGGGPTVEELAGLGLRPTGLSSDESQLGWVLAQADGQAAGRFAHLAPTPGLEWLGVLTRQGLLPGEPPLVAATRAEQQRSLGRPAVELAQWLLKHLEDVRLVDWVLERGGVLHADFRDMLNFRLSESPLADKDLQQLWQILASDWYGAAVSAQPGYTNVAGRLRSEPWSGVLCREVIHHLTPHLVLAPRQPESQRSGLARYAQARLAVPAGFDMESLEMALERHGQGRQILAELAEPLAAALVEALELLKLAGQADARHDWTIYARPSVEELGQDLTEKDWSQLIGLAYRAWKALWEQEPQQARALVRRWQTMPFPVFRRLTFAAMAETVVEQPQEALEFLLEQEAWWLWSRQARREMFLLLKSLAPKLNAAKLARLVRSILNGPPRGVLPEHVGDEAFAVVREDMIWLRLAKLEAAGAKLPQQAAARKQELEEGSERRRLSDDNSEELRSGVILGGTMARTDLLLAMLEESTPEVENGWRQVLEEDLTLAGTLLKMAAARGRWRVERWQELLRWEGLAGCRELVWQEWLPALAEAPEGVWRALSADLARWLQQEICGGEPWEGEGELCFWRLWDRTAEVALRTPFETGAEAVERAELHPAGILASTLLQYLAHLNPKSGMEVPPPAWQRLNILLAPDQPGRVAATLTLCRSIDWLYTVVPEWTGINLLPMLDWRTEAAGACWQAFCYNLCFSAELWPQLKDEFLLSLRHAPELGKPVEAAYGWLAFILIDRPDWLNEEESRRALMLLPPEGRSRVASGLLVRLEGASDREGFWRQRLAPIFERRWPKDLRLRDRETSYNLATLCIESGEAFPEAVRELKPMLAPVTYRGRFLSELTRHGRAQMERHPGESLELLYLCVAEARREEPRLLREALAVIRRAAPGIEEDARYRALQRMIE